MRRALTHFTAIPLVTAAIALQASAIDAAARPIVTSRSLSGLPALAGFGAGPSRRHHHTPAHAQTPRHIRIPAPPKVTCREAIPPPSADVRASWKRFTVLVNTARCRGVDLASRAAAIATMLEPSACVSIPQPVPTTPAAIATACAKKITWVIDIAALTPFRSRIDNLLVVGDRAYGDVVAVGNVRFQQLGSTWVLTQLY